MKTVEAARGRWFGILRQFGLDERYLRNKHGPCPICDGKDRFRWDDKDGSGSYYCSQCGPGDGMALLMRYTGLDFAGAAKAVDEIVNNVQHVEPKPKADPRLRLRKAHSGLGDMSGINPVRMYLRSRGLKPAQATQYHPSMTYFEDGRQAGAYPAMLHMLHSANGEPLTYHVTYLTRDGSKAPVSAPRKVLPPVAPLAGGAIRLAPSGPVLGIAEGIETALAASALDGIPVWAAYSATLLEQWRAPEGVVRVVVYGDHDESYTGQAAAYALAKRLRHEGYAVTVRIPERVGDWADEVSA